MRRLSSPVFIGRVAELAELGDAAARAAAGNPAAVLVAGEAGVGKTRFLAEFTVSAEANGYLVLRGACMDLGHGVLPYAPVVEALRPLARDPGQHWSGTLGPEREDLAQLLPELVPAAVVAGSRRDGDQGRLFETALRVLGRLADAQPTVLVLEDLHWADTSTRDLIGFLARNVFRERLLLVGSYRTDDVHRGHPLRAFLAELDRTGVLRIELPRFSRDQVAVQLGAIGGRDPDPEMVNRVFARSAGNAFFTEELAAADAGTANAPLPPTLRDILDARIQRLSDGARLVLQAVAVAGRSLDESLLGSVTGLEDGRLAEALREALADQILIVADTDRYAFRHALFQEAVYADLLAGERKRLHTAMAEALQWRPDLGAIDGAGSRAERAHHWYAARRLPEALAESVAAALVAEQAYAFPEALTHYERALDLWDDVDDGADRVQMDRIEVVRRAGIAAHRSSQDRRAVALFREALAGVDEVAEPLRAGELHALLIGPLVTLEDRDAVNRAVDDGFRLIPADPPTAIRSVLLRGRARSLLYDDRYEESRAAASEALLVARQAGARAESGDAVDTLIFASVFAGDVEGALEYATERLRQAEREGDLAGIGRGWNEVGFVLQADLRFDEAIDVLRAGAAAVTDVGLERSWRSHLEWAAAESMRRTGRWQEADVLSEAAVARGGPDLVQAHELRALLLPAMGRLDEAERHADFVWTTAEGRLTVAANRSYYPARADIAIWRGQYQVAGRAVADGMELYAHSDDVRWIGELVVRGLRIEADLAEIARAHRSGKACADARRRAETLLRRMLRVARRAGETKSIFARESEAPVRLARAEFSRLLGASDPERWSAAAEAWSAIHQPYQVAYARYRQAEAMLKRRVRRDAVEAVLRDARDAAAMLGARPLLGEIETLATRARVPLGNVAANAPAPERGAPPDPLSAYGLTEREREVLGLVAAGRSDRQIGEALFISGKTVSVHVSNIKGKLGAASRLEVATLALRLASPEPPAAGVAPAGAASRP